MPTFADAFLAKYATTDRQTRAAADVALLGTFPAAWDERLLILRTYILACMENQAETEDLFSAKLKTYRAEFDKALPQAQAAQDAEDETVTGRGIFSIPLERA